jgi:hypothetical protein
MKQINGYKPLSSSFKEAWEYLLTFKENWDGNGAKPLNEDVYKNALEIIKADEEEHLLDDWEVSLNINGSLYFTYEDKNTTSMINLGDKMFSYFIKYKGKVVNKSDGDYYSCNNFMNIIRRVSNHTAEDKTEARLDIGPNGDLQKPANQVVIADYPLVMAENQSEKLLF